MSKPKISVIIPIYNLESCLAATLESVVNQTHKNLEIILVNDGSADGSLALAKEYAERDSRITVIDKENGGVSSARNAGLDAASGDYIGFVDGDDVIAPDMYEYLLDLAEKHGADIAACGMLLDGAAVCMPRGDTAVRDRHALSVRSVRKIFSGSCCTRIYRREVVEGVRFSEEYPIGEDLLYNLHAYSRANTTVFGSEAKYRYVTHESSAVHKPRTGDSLTSYRRMLGEAMLLFGGVRAVRKYLIAENLKNNADMCSRIVLSESGSTDGLYRELRREVRRHTASVIFSRDIGFKMKLKLLLLAYLDGLYKRGVRKAHSTK